MAPSRRPSMGERIDGAAPAATVTPIARGRGAFSAAAPPAAASTPAADAGSALEVRIGLIDPSPANPRSSLGDLTQLADSIRELGVLQPLMVRPNGDRFALIYGHRRLAAAKLAKRKTVPVLFNLDADEVRDHARRLVENLHREDLTPLDEARAFQQLLDLGVAGGQRGLVKLVSRSQPYISKRLSLLRLPEAVQAKLDNGGISLSDAIELARLADEPAALKRAVKQGETVWGGYPAVVKRELQSIEDEKARTAAGEALRAAGVTILEGNPSYSRSDGPYPVYNLPVEGDEHAKLPCHAAVVPSHGSAAVLVCTDPQLHLGGDKEALAQEREREAAERAEHDAARLAAARARCEFSIGLVRKGTPDAGAAVLMTQLIGRRHYYARVDEAMVVELLGINLDTFNGAGPAEAIDAFVAKGTRNAQRAVYAAGLALGESAITGHDASQSAVVAYLDHLVACGYQLSGYEKELLADDDEDEGDYDLDEDGEDDGGADADETTAGEEGEA